jgi:hypothetical protein
MTSEAALKGAEYYVPLSQKPVQVRLFRLKRRYQVFAPVLEVDQTVSNNAYVESLTMPLDPAGSSRTVYLSRLYI